MENSNSYIHHNKNEDKLDLSKPFILRNMSCYMIEVTNIFIEKELISTLIFPNSFHSSLVFFLSSKCQDVTCIKLAVFYCTEDNEN